MENKKKLIIITSDAIKDENDRFIRKDSEWNAWFNDKKVEDKSNKDSESENKKAVVCRINKELNGLTLKNIIESNIPKDFDICWINGNCPSSENNTNSRNNVCKILKKLVSNKSESKIYIAYHDEWVNSTCNIIKNFKHKQYGFAKNNENQFNKIWNKTEKVFKTDAPFEDYFEAFFLNLPEAFSVLKHHIVHIALASDIDLQGISELKAMEEDGLKSKTGSSLDYLKEILQDNDLTYFRQKLAGIQFMICKKSFGDGGQLHCNNQFSGDFVKALVSDNDLVEKKSFFELMEESDKSCDEFMPTLLALTGLTKDTGGFVADSNSPIFKFMCLMDCCINKRDNLTQSDVSTVLNFFGKNSWRIKGSNPEAINSFNDWTRALTECLENICAIAGRQ